MNASLRPTNAYPLGWSCQWRALGPLYPLEYDAASLADMLLEIGGGVRIFVAPLYAIAELPSWFGESVSCTRPIGGTAMAKLASEATSNHTAAIMAVIQTRLDDLHQFDPMPRALSPEAPGLVPSSLHCRRST
jgi:hypothetical protein